VRLIPSTDGTGVDASTAAATPEKADDKKENDTDEDIEELIIVHDFIQQVRVVLLTPDS
jgi:hypothetical protein